jgi:hypothetical protein
LPGVTARARRRLIAPSALVIAERAADQLAPHPEQAVNQTDRFANERGDASNPPP